MRPNRADAALVLGACVVGSSASASSVPTAVQAIASPTTSVTAELPQEDAPEYCTRVWSTTDTTISRNQWVGPTLETIVMSKTITTLEKNRPLPTSYPATLIDIFISRVTYEYQMTFSDGHTSTDIISQTYSFPITRVQSWAPTATLPCGD